MPRYTKLLSMLLLPVVMGLAATPANAQGHPSYAIFAEYARDANKVIQPRLNRRVFNTVEAQAGSDITLNTDGSITLEPGTYRITGMSIVTMQTTFAPPMPLHNTNYPGFCVLYPTALEASPALAMNLVGVGSPQNALDANPSLFDVIYSTSERVDLALGHQSGPNTNGEVYLSVFEVSGMRSNLHVFARIAITKMFDPPSEGN